MVIADVLEPKSRIAVEPVSPRFIRSLPHPDRSASFPVVEFTPDNRLVVSGYPSGIIQVFDPAKGVELRRIDAPRGYRGSFNYVRLSPAGDRFFFALDNSKFNPVQQGERKTFFREYTGEIRLYDLQTGKLATTLNVTPRRGVMAMALSPDARRIATMEYSSGRSEDFDKLRALYAWDVAKRTVVKLRDGYGDPFFSADGNTVYVTVTDYRTHSTSVYVHDAATGNELAQRHLGTGSWSFRPSPDGKYIAAAMVDDQKRQGIVQLLDPVKLSPLATVTADVPAEIKGLGFLHFTPDGKRLIAAGQATVFLWDVSHRKLLKRWKLDTPGRVWRVALDRAGERLAATTWFVPPELQGARDEALTPRDFPQPVVYLIDLENENKPERIVCPHGYWGQPSFSPDGKLLAVGGAGAVHLFDVSR